MDRAAWIALLLYGAAVTVAALAGSLSTIDAAEQYGELEQPAWAPPGWLFGPVWSLLYVAIALAGWRIWLAERWSTNTGLWGGQLAMNAIWSPIFFAWEMRALSLVWIIALDALVALLIWRTWRSGWPAWILLPYLAWILFATALNAAVWWLN